MGTTAIFKDENRALQELARELAIIRQHNLQFKEGDPQHGLLMLPQLLQKYLKNGRITRVRRGVYRIVHFPAGEHEDLAALWLWSERQGIFSHETALMLHELSDVLPRKVHLTLPSAWSRRRLRVPKGVVLHHADVPKDEQVLVGAIPITTPLRTLLDCAEAHVPPELMTAAVRQAKARGLLQKNDLKIIRARVRLCFAICHAGAVVSGAAYGSIASLTHFARRTNRSKASTTASGVDVHTTGSTNSFS